MLIFFISDIFPQKDVFLGVTEYQVVVGVNAQKPSRIFVHFLDKLVIVGAYILVLHKTLLFIMVGKHEWNIGVQVNDCVFL